MAGDNGIKPIVPYAYKYTTNHGDLSVGSAEYA